MGDVIFEHIKRSKKSKQILSHTVHLAINIFNI